MRVAALRGGSAAARLGAGGSALLVFACGTVLSAVAQRHLLEAAQTAQRLVEFNIGEAFGLAACVSLVLAGPRAVLGRGDLVVLLVAALAWFVPEHHGVYLATTLAGMWFLLARRSDRLLRDLSHMWLALSVYELWGKLLFKLAYQLIEVFEVAVIQRFGRLLFDGIAVDGARISVRGDWSVVLLEGCSSFHNLSLTVLIWLSILKIARHPADAAAARALGVSACLVVAVNVTRILAMLPSREAYLFWHDGSGATVVALGSVAAAIVPILLCVERGACRPMPHR
ncbi:hypothetical protein [Methylobacterium sp. J-067]|uniref:hypothetical protein n=1 Tax=Methylobacterium sp. J-067 TaxID=2836648 RepID=UPI001FB9889A|nr:hypothetical protein [Methylobacterium sp. J-067]MCJ2023830.1 hypothetical protein [Methylobacterium sp. J-067]